MTAGPGDEASLASEVADTGMPEWLSIRDDGISWRVVDGEVVVLNLRSGRYFSLNGTGTLIWERMAAGAATTAELGDLLVGEYDVGSTQAHVDAAALVQELMAADLVVLTGETPPADDY